MNKTTWMLARALAVVVIQCMTANAGATASDRVVVRTQGPTIPAGFVALDGRRQVDCSDAVTKRPCRARLNEHIEVVDALLMSGEGVLREGDELLFAYRGNARTVALRGGLQYPLSRLEGTDIWVVRLKVPDLDRLVLSYAFAIDAAPPPPTAYARWRGAAAPAAVAVADPLQGHSEWISVSSAVLPEARRVYIYRSPAPESDGLRVVVYMADGQIADDVARVVEPLVLAGSIPPVLIVGVEAAAGAARHEEYVPALGKRSGRFDAYQRFLAAELLPFVERRHGVSGSRVCRMAAGVSNGADWAIATALRQPRLFTHVVAFAAGWSVADVPADAAATSFYLGAGTLDTRYHRNTRRIAAALAAAGVRQHFADVVGGHDIAVWTHLFAQAMRWSLSGSACTPSPNPPASMPESPAHGTT